MAPRRDIPPRPDDAGPNWVYNPELGRWVPPDAAQPADTAADTPATDPGAGGGATTPGGTATGTYSTNVAGQVNPLDIGTPWEQQARALAALQAQEAAAQSAADQALANWQAAKQSEASGDTPPGSAQQAWNAYINARTALTKLIADEQQGAKYIADAKDADNKTRQKDPLTDAQVAQARALQAHYEAQQKIDAIDLQQKQLEYQLAADPNNIALKNQADQLANEKSQWDIYDKSLDDYQKGIDAQYGPALAAANVTGKNLGNQATAINNQFLAAQNTANLNATQMAIYAAQLEAATNAEKLRRLQEGDYAAKAEDLQRLVDSGQISHEQALSVLDAFMQGTTPYDQQRDIQQNLLSAGNSALQQGAVFAPGQAEALHGIYSQMGGAFGMPAINVPASGRSVPQYAASLGLSTVAPYQQATRAGQPSMLAAGSLNGVQDAAGLDTNAVWRALGAQVGMPQTPTIPAMPQAPTLATIPPTAAPDVGVPVQQPPGSPPPAPRPQAPVAAAGSLNAGNQAAKPRPTSPPEKRVGGFKEN